MIINFNAKEKELLARIMRAEALNEGELGMLMVGNVIINRCLSNCLTFKNVNTIEEVIYQKNQFVGIKSSLFNSNPTEKELELAERILRGEYYYPATNALWFYAPKTKQSCTPYWYDQELAGRYNNHCFYKPSKGTCKEIY